MRGEQDEAIVAALERERPRLRGWLRRQLVDPAAVEDVLQDVFYELVLAYRLGKPLQEVGAWLFRVARNRIIDLRRRKRPERLDDSARRTDDGDTLPREDTLRSAAPGPATDYVQSLLADELAAALDELPPEQRDAFLAHEVDGIPFAALAEVTGVGVNTLLSRKHYAVLKLRERLREIHEQVTADWEGTR